MSKYVISQDQTSKLWYAHAEGFPYIPVFSSIGTKRHAQNVADMYNESKGKRPPKGSR